MKYNILNNVNSKVLQEEDIDNLTNDVYIYNQKDFKVIFELNKVLNSLNL